jgi:hypothetical protein
MGGIYTHGVSLLDILPSNQMNRKSLLRAWICVLFVPAFASATPIAGEFGMGGSASITAAFVDYVCDLGGCPVNTGDFKVSPITTTGTFAALGNTKGFIKDISMLGGQPLNTSFNLAPWISFVAAPTLFLDLQFIPVGQGTPSADCVGVTFCTPTMAALVSPNNPLGLSPYNLGPGSASLEVRGIGYTGSSATGSTPFISRVSADFAGLSAANILALFTSSGTINKAYSANFVVSLIPGDFDGDGDVGGRDFLVWQRNPSIGNLTDWQANYGTGSLVAANVAVPEPVTLLLLMLLTAGGCVSRQTA